MGGGRGKAHEPANFVLAAAKGLYVNGQATDQMVDAVKRLGRALDCALGSYRAGANCNLWPRSLPRTFNAPDKGGADLQKDW